MKSKKNIFLYCFLFVFLLSCHKEKWRNVQLVSPDGTQTITIITIENRRYIMNGNYDTISKTEYAIVDISRVDRLGDEIGVCWKVNGHKWELISLYSELIENKLNKKNYSVSGGIDFDRSGIPTAKKYFGKSCDLIYIRTGLVRPGNGTKIKFK